MNFKRRLCVVLFALGLQGMARGDEPDAVCKAPDVVVPMLHLRAVVKACLREGKLESATAFSAMNSILLRESCGTAYKHASSMCAQLNCVAAKRDIGDAIFNQVVTDAITRSRNEESSRRECANNRLRMEEALAKGSADAAAYLMHTALHGEYKGLCGAEDFKVAAQYMLRGARLHDADMSVELALTILNKRFPEAIKDLVSPMTRDTYSRLAEALGRELPALSDSELRDLLIGAAMKSQPLAADVLERVYSRGLLGERRIDLALAWGAMDVEFADADNPGPQNKRFKLLYESADEQQRSAACGALRKWTSENVNFRVASADLKNAFARKCFDPGALVEKEEACLADAEVNAIDSTLASGLPGYATCHE